MKNKNLEGEIMTDKTEGIKPNFSAVAREYHVSRNTVRKYWESDGEPLRKKPERHSRLDPYMDEIVELMSKPNVTKKAVFNYLKRKYPDDIKWNYNTFKWFTLKHDIAVKRPVDPHPSYETDPGEQLQVDWKENMKIHLKSGELIEFNVFSATLGYSRMHVFVYSRTKTTEDFIRCVIDVYRRLGGVTKTLLTDNMAAIVSVRGKNKKVYPEITHLFQDLGIKLILCRPRVPQTKGKDENANKFVKWIYPYDGVLESEEDIIRVIENDITAEANMQVNTGTHLPPAVLFRNEKEYLDPVPNKVMLDSYNIMHHVEKVSSTMDVYYRGSRYSVPPECIGRRVDIFQFGDSIYIYQGSKLVTIHTLTYKKKNYKKEHYKKAYQAAYGKSSEIDRRAAENLRRLEEIENIRKPQKAGTEAEKTERKKD